jgi:hypothetical protein
MPHSSKKEAGAAAIEEGINSKPNLEVGNDYAHYPPTPTKIVTKHLTKKLKNTEVSNTGNNIGVGEVVTAQKERITNRSEKIVNSDESDYSGGSARAFEATEQALE